MADKIKIIIIALISLFFLITILALLYNNPNENIIKEIFNQKTQDNPLSIKDSSNINNSKDIVENNQDTNPSKSSGEGSSSIFSSSCSNEQIVYSMIDFNKTSVCNEYSLGNCVDKTVACSVNVENKDSKLMGEFEIELIFVESKKLEEDAFDKKILTFSLGPGQTRKISDATRIQSAGQDGLANKEINCLFNTLKVPKKEVC